MLVSKHRRYLSGQDWVISTLDYLMKSMTCSGNMSQVVLMLHAALDEQEVRERLNRFVRAFPVLEGTLSRDWKLSPFWKIAEASERDAAISFTPVPDLSLPAALLPLVEKTANRRFSDDREHLAFHYFKSKERSALALAFDHRIFDARGAETFLNLFQQSLSNGNPSGDIAFTSTRALTEWMKKFLAGRNVNRRIIALSKSSPKAIPLPSGNGRGFKYRLLSFSEEETARIYDRAYREAGYLLESPFLLAVVTQTVHELMKDRQEEGESYLVPVTMDLRPGKDPLEETFFNHVSYLFYQVPLAEAEDLKSLITSLKQQMYDQVKSGFPRDLAEASLLTRIAPLPLLGKLLHLPLKGKMATFVFSHLGKSAYQSKELMGAGVDTIFHMPRVPAPPGLGFFSNYYNGRLNLVISHLDGLLTDDEVWALERESGNGSERDRFYAHLLRCAGGRRRRGRDCRGCFCCAGRRYDGAGRERPFSRGHGLCRTAAADLRPLWER